MSEYYNMGWDAYWDGYDLDSNPFDPIDQSWARLQWDMGWTEAEDESAEASF